MPCTPYHFGPSTFFALVFKKWIDLPVFVLANIVVDLEVLYFRQWPVHRYFHTLLIGAVVGAAWGILAYPARGIFKKIMQVIRLPYKSNLPKMIISGILGVWLHVLTDAVYHYDVRIFWPSNARPLFNLISKVQVEAVCIGFWVAVIIVYGICVTTNIKSSGQKPQREAGD